MHKKTRGFTIVELLIVIVVIGILASIVVVAYRGVREAAADAKRAAAIDQYAKVLNIYRIQNGSLPTEEGCIGETKNYPETSDFEAGVCYKEGSYSVSVNEELNNKLKSVTTNLPDPTGLTYITDKLASNEIKIRGMVYSGSALIYYDSEKNGITCPNGEHYVDSGTAICYVSIDN